MFTFILAPLGKDYLHHSGWALEKEKVAGWKFALSNKFCKSKFFKNFIKKIFHFTFPQKYGLLLHSLPVAVID